MNNLKFRRQFFLGSCFLEYETWNKIHIGDNHFLTTHPDLEVNQVIKNGNSLTLLGFAIDPFNPKDSNKEILERMLEGVKDFGDIIDRSYPFGGRWIFIFNNAVETKLFTDPCALRQAFYTMNIKGLHCGSQPTILAENLNIRENEDESLLDFIQSEEFKRKENSWIGDSTPYSEIKHLLPNHYLNLLTGDVNRFWIDKEKTTDVEEIAKKGSQILKGSLLGAKHRYSLMLGLTAGWDSRTLLAASKEIKNDVKYWVGTMNVLKATDYDIRTPKRLSERLGLKLKLIDELPPLKEEFVKILKKNISIARILGKTRMIQYHLENSRGMVNINGNASEIVRNHYGVKHPKNVNAQYLASLDGYDNSNYVIHKLDEWIEPAKELCINKDFNLIDLFYWEQRMGNWGALFQAEQDLALEAYSPFNNRELILTLAKADVKYRQAPHYLLYVKLLEELWKETLEEPINGGRKAIIRQQILKLIPKSLKEKLKSKLN